MRAPYDSATSELIFAGLKSLNKSEFVLAKVEV